MSLELSTKKKVDEVLIALENAHNEIQECLYFRSSEYSEYPYYQDGEFGVDHKLRALKEIIDSVRSEILEANKEYYRDEP